MRYFAVVTLTRPTTIDDMKARMEHFSTEEGQARGLGIEILPTDVFINTYPKAGTTWVQQIVHQLRSGGDRWQFGEICDVVPWLGLAYDSGVDPLRPGRVRAPSRSRPTSAGAVSQRALGTSTWCVTRWPRCAPSTHSLRAGCSSPARFRLPSLPPSGSWQGTGSGNYWNFLVEWWPQLGRRRRAGDGLRAHDGRLGSRRVTSRRIHWDHDESAIDGRVRNSSRAVMAEHADKFDEHVLRAARDPVMGLPPGGTSHKAGRRALRGSAGETLVPSTSCGRHPVEPLSGSADYDALADAIAAL